MARLDIPGEVISIAYSKFAAKYGDGGLTIFKQPRHLTIEIEGRRGKSKATLYLTFAAAQEMAREILEATQDS